MASQVCVFLLTICIYFQASYVNSRRHKEIKSAWIVRSCQQGEEERRGSFIFRCQAQRMMPSACIMDDGSLTPIGSTSEENGFVVACQEGDWEAIERKIVGCVDDMGQQVQANSMFQWQGGQYRCIVNPNGGAEIQPAGFDQPFN